MINKIVIGDLTISPENGYFIQSIKDLGYKTKYPVATVLNYHGVRLGDAFFQNRNLAFEMKVLGSSQSDLIEKRNNLYKFLTIKESSGDLIDIEITLANNLTLKTQGVIKEVSSDIDAQILVASDISFIFETESPFFKSSQIYEVDIPITKGGGCSIPMAIPLNMSQGSSGFKTISALGSIFSFPTIYFYGTLTNPVLHNLSTNQSMSYGGTISSGNWVKVETFDRVVVDNLGNNKRDKISGDYLFLDVGENNFKLATDVPTEDGYVKLIYQYFYISI